ncbi:hypothetical protein DCS32_08585 [Dokdonia sp. Dokd-P16]|uniref:hypothetical protein n=1 Tax=Dokdonia sp. Dokd-P16 TaxID=2173169 RepID=UPI000D545802|nr:hypothetical protein [Dokdonia sp. Dokd-P16]AWH74216.1 hypothetical protein DCS32_08585 [Dokdonia sp. Dokd-P16]
MINQIKIENLLNSSISELSKLLNCNLGLDITKSFYINTNIICGDLLGKKYSSVALFTDENNLVNSISIRFNCVFEEIYYEKLIEEYGNPDSILIKPNEDIINKTKTVLNENLSHDFSQKLTKSTFNLVHGTLDQNPLLVIWNLYDFQIKIIRRYNSNINNIIFSRN